MWTIIQLSVIFSKIYIHHKIVAEVLQSFLIKKRKQNQEFL